MENIFESNVNSEKMEKIPEVVLHLFRHGEQYKDPNKTNLEYELTEAGQKQAIKKSDSISKERNLSQAVAFGSPRKRAQQTAGLAMTGGFSDTITGTESLGELKEKIDKDIKIGSKIGVDPRLDFHLDKNTPFGHEAYEAVFTKKEYLKFLVERSDALAIKTNDELASTYSRQASNIAKIVKKYISVSNQWNKLVESGKYKDAKLERFLGSHGGVVESFLLKAIEKIKGIEERNRLLDLMPHQFNYTEGMDVTIKNVGQDQMIHILFKKEDKNNPEKNFIFDEDIPPETIDDIINETGVISE
jgi:hypothetical protein